MNVPPDQPAYQIADDVAWISSEDYDPTEPAAYIARIPQGPALVLSGSGLIVWLAVLEGGTLSEIVADCAEITDSKPEDIAGDVAALLDELLHRGVIVVREAA